VTRNNLESSQEGYKEDKKNVKYCNKIYSHLLKAFKYIDPCVSKAFYY